jgi:hypothetical protein
MHIAFSHANILVTRVIKPIKKGEEVCTTYSNMMLCFQYANKISRMIALAP